MRHDAGPRAVALRRLIASTLAGVIGICVVAVVGASVAGIDSRTLFEDLQKIADVPFYTGVLSHLGVSLWYCSVAISVFTALVLRTRPWPALRGRPDLFLAGWALLGFMLATDDLLLVHERIAPAYLRVPEEAVVLGYAAVLGYLIVRWWLFVTRRTPVVILWLSLGCFAVSLAVEYASAEQTRLSIVLEDGTKLAGIALWLLYSGAVGYETLRGDGRPLEPGLDFGPPGTSATVRSDDRSRGARSAGFSNIGDETASASSQAVNV